MSKYLDNNPASGSITAEQDSTDNHPSEYHDTMNPNEQHPDPSPPENGDGAELTAPSAAGEPIAKSEPQTAAEFTADPENVTSEKQAKKKGDIFDDLASLGRTLEEITPSEKLLTMLSVRKPEKDEWVRSHLTIATPINIYEPSNSREIYLILPAALEALESVARRVRMTLAVNYAGEAFVWPVPIPAEKNPHRCHVAAQAAAAAAVKSWIRIVWKGNDYEVSRRIDNSKIPEWPTEIADASAMLRFACKAGGIEVIDSPDHPVARGILGL